MNFYNDLMTNKEYQVVLHTDTFYNFNYDFDSDVRKLPTSNYYFSETKNSIENPHYTHFKQHE